MRAATQPEKYYPPKQLVLQLKNAHGLSVSVGYIYAVKRASVRDGLFVVGCARASELVAWLRSHPTFSKRRPAELVAA